MHVTLNIFSVSGHAERGSRPTVNLSVDVPGLVWSQYTELSTREQDSRRNPYTESTDRLERYSIICYYIITWVFWPLWFEGEDFLAFSPADTLIESLSVQLLSIYLTRKQEEKKRKKRVFFSIQNILQWVTESTRRRALDIISKPIDHNKLHDDFFSPSL